MNASVESSETDGADTKLRPWYQNWCLRGGSALAVLLVAGLAVWAYRDYISWDYLASWEDSLREYQAQRPAVVYAASATAFVVVYALGLPVGATMTVLFGWLFGFLPALLLCSFSSTAGGAVAFLSSRYLFQDGVKKWLGRTLDRFEKELHQEGAFYLFVTRLIPQIPYVLVNVVLGLSPLRLRTFWWVSQLAMLPATVVYVWVGSSLPSLQTIAEEGLSAVVSWQLFAAIAAIGLIPLAIRLGLRWYFSSAGDKG